jgi:hypothetical protein
MLTRMTRVCVGERKMQIKRDVLILEANLEIEI